MLLVQNLMGHARVTAVEDWAHENVEDTLAYEKICTTVRLSVMAHNV